VTLPRIYLAGGKDSEWKKTLQDRWGSRALLIDPFKDSVQGSLYLFTYDDLQHIRESDILLGYQTYHRFDGMALEWGFAHALGKVLIYVPQLPRVSSMMAAISTAVFTDLDAAAAFIEERYL